MANTDTSVAGQITLQLTGSATPAAYQTLLKGITFSNSGQDPMSNDRTATIIVNDGQLDSNVYTALIHVVPVDNAPVETAPAQSGIASGASLSLSGLAVSDVDANGAPETVTMTAAHGTITLGSTANLTGVAGNGTGSVTFTGTLADLDAALGTASYTPGAGFSGTDTVTFSTNDNGNSGNGGPLTTNATLPITVWAPPVANADSFGTAAGSPIVIHPLANDTDPNAGFTLSIAAINGAPVAVGTPVTVNDGVTGAPAGTVTVDASGNMTFTPNAGYAGTPSFTYTDSDGHGGIATATVTGTVWAPPMPTDDTFLASPGVATKVPVLANDTDPNTGFTLSVTAIDGTPIVAGGPAVTIDHGTVKLNTDGTLTYASASNYHGSEALTYTVSDGHGGTATANVTGTAAPPRPT